MVAGRGSYPFFLATLKKPKKNIQEVLDRLEGMTDAEIDVAMVPKWTKPHLKRYRDEKFPTAEQEAQRMILQAKLDNPLGLKKTQKFEVRKYDGDTRWLGPDNKSQIEINAGDVFMVIAENGVRWGTAFVGVDKQQMGYIQQRSESIGRMTPEEYTIYKNDELKKKFGMEDQKPDPSGKITSADYTHSADRYAGEILNSESHTNIGGNGFPILFKRH